ncbi:MAG: helix-turn-helix domain-containing protein [Myxococcota bacterium]
MERLDLGPVPVADDPTTLVLGPSEALTCARTAGVPLFRRCPPVHSILVGRCQFELDGSVAQSRVLAVPANTPHTLHALFDEYACAAYLDARRYSFEHVQRLAETWSGFVPGHDDLREAFGDALRLPQRRVDRRLLRALDAIQHERLRVVDAAARVGLSSSRLTHMMTEQLGAPPRKWAAWFKLTDAIAHSVFTGANLTRAAHEADFADSAHLTRTSKQLTGVRPAMMLPQRVFVAPEGLRPSGRSFGSRVRQARRCRATLADGQFQPDGGRFADSAHTAKIVGDPA